MQADPISWFV